MDKRTVGGWFRYWAQALLLPVYGFSFLFPRNRKIWLFGSTFGKRFTDNPRYFYLYMNQRHKDSVRAIWISHKKEVVEFLVRNGCEAYHHRSLRGIWYCLRGKVYIFDNYSKDISFWLSGGAKKINLWHGVALKKINHDNLHDEIRHPKNNRERFRFALRTMSDEKPSHFVLATSKRMAWIYAGAFRVPLNHVVVGGYPRNDALFGDGECFRLVTEKERRVIDKLLRFKERGRKVVLYLPTFRDSENMFFEVMNLEVFQSFLKENGFAFFTKLHPKSKLNQEFMNKIVNTSEKRSKDDDQLMIYIESEVDVYSILKYADVLVTDYSSVYADFLLLNRPSVLFPYDYEVYTRNTRDAYFEYGEYMKDEKAFTMEELMEKLVRVVGNDRREKDRREALAWMFEDEGGNACEGLYGKIKRIIGMKHDKL